MPLVPKLAVTTPGATLPVPMVAAKAVVNAPKQLTQAFSQLGINAGDLTGYFLNDNNPLPQLQQKLNQAQIMEAGLQSGLTVNPTSQNYAGQLAQEGVTYGQAVAGYQKVADVLPAANALSSIYSWAQPYNQQSAEQENLGGNGQAQLARENLGRQETAQFSGTSAAGQKSFAAQSAGTGF